MQVSSKTRPGKEWRAARDKVFLIVMLAAVGTAVACVLPHHADLTQDLMHDSRNYNSLALGLLRHQTYGSAYLQPGYPVFLAFIYSFAGPNLLMVYVFQGILYVLTLGLLYRISLYLTGLRSTSAIAVCLCLVIGALRTAVTSVCSEILAGALVTAGIFHLLKAVARPSLRASITIGLLSGALSLTRSTFFPFVFVILLFVIFSGQDRKLRLAHGGLILAIVACFIVPWTLRNYKVTGAIVPISTGGGYNFWKGNWPGWEEGRGWKRFPPEVEPLLVGKSEVEQDRILTRIALGCIIEHPVRALRSFARKFGALWLGNFGIDPKQRPGNADMPHIGSCGIPKSSVPAVAVFGLAVYGWFCLPRDAKRRAYPILAVLAYWTAVYVATVAQLRYSLPVKGFELMLSAVGLRQLSLTVARRRPDASAGRTADVVDRAVDLQSDQKSWRQENG